MLRKIIYTLLIYLILFIENGIEINFNLKLILEQYNSGVTSL